MDVIKDVRRGMEGDVLRAREKREKGKKGKSRDKEVEDREGVWTMVDVPKAKLETNGRVKGRVSFQAPSPAALATRGQGKAAGKYVRVARAGTPVNAKVTGIEKGIGLLLFAKRTKTRKPASLDKTIAGMDVDVDVRVVDVGAGGKEKQ